MWDETTQINFKLPTSLKNKIRRHVGTGRMSPFIRSCVEKEFLRIESAVDIEQNEVFNLESASWYDLDLVYNEESNCIRDEVLAISHNGRNVKPLVIPFCGQVKRLVQKEADHDMAYEYLLNKMESY